MANPRKRKGLAIDGWINLDKPLGMSSAGAVAKIKYLLKAAKVGHGGTLDPLATGVLPIALGEATKLLPYVVERGKTYEFTVVWGEARDSGDAEGRVVAQSDHRPTMAEIDAVLPEFIGMIAQVPPAHSAIKVDGRRAYDLARAGETVVLAPRMVEITALVRQDDDPVATRFRVDCGKGTYVRSIARDLAIRLGTRGHVGLLRRTAVGAMRAEDSIFLETIAEIGDKAPRAGLIAPLTTVLDDIPALAVTAEQARRLRNGGDVRHKEQNDDGVVAILHHGQLVAMAESKAGLIRPLRVFHPNQDGVNDATEQGVHDVDQR